MTDGGPQYLAPATCIRPLSAMRAACILAELPEHYLLTPADPFVRGLLAVCMREDEPAEQSASAEPFP